ncbi:MAG: DotA/TraY family protein [Alphaproteobacteria bacterium]|nr:DotA/TraY family protein [Alphaproteobacteria bacterium SS10]
MNSNLWMFVWMVAVALVAVVVPGVAWASGATPPEAGSVEAICQGGLFCVTAHDVSAGWIAAAFPDLVQLATDEAPTGTPVEITSPSTTLAAALQVLNSAALAVGSLILTYKLLAGIVQTANDGEVLGKRWSTLWGPVRVAISASLIVPTASGYCLAQALVVAIALSGVGLANRIWEVTVEQMMTADGMIGSQVHPPHERITKQIFANNVCLHLMNGLWLYHKGDNPRSAIEDDAASAGGWSVHPSWAGWNWTGAGNIYAGFPGGGRDFGGVQFANGSLFYRRADWRGDGDGWFDPSATYMGWTVVDVGWWEEVKSFFGASKRPDSCGRVDVRVPEVDASTGSIWTSVTNFFRDEEEVTAEASAAAALSGLAYRVALVHTEQMETLAKRLDRNAWQLVQTELIQHLDNPDAAYLRTLERPPEVHGAEIAQAAIDYRTAVTSQVNNELRTFFTSEPLAQQYIRAAKDGGWAVAGEWFLQIMKMNAMVHRMVSATPVTTAQPEHDTLCDKINCSDDNVEAIVNRGIDIMRNFHDDSVASHMRAMASTPDPDPQLQARLRSMYRSVGSIGSNQIMGGSAEERAIQVVSNQIMAIAAVYATDIGAGVLAGDMGFSDVLGEGVEGLFMGGLVALTADGSAGAAVGSATAAAGEGFVSLTNLRMDTGNSNPIAAVITLGRALWATGLGILFAVDDRQFTPADAATVMALTSMQQGSGIVAGVGSELLSGMSDRLAGIMAWIGRIMLLPGFLLGYLFPYLPWLLWVGGLVGWFILVMEAVIAAPLWALAHMRMDGEGIMGPAGNQGYMLALALLLRPALMLIGLISGMVLIYIFAPFLGVSLMAVSELNRGAGSALDLMSVLMSIGLLAFVMVTTCYKAFGMINQVPDRVLRWIGSGGSSDGREDEFRSGAFALVNAASLTAGVSAAAGVGEEQGNNGAGSGEQAGADGGRGGSGQRMSSRASRANENLPRP